MEWYEFWLDLRIRLQYLSWEIVQVVSQARHVEVPHGFKLSYFFQHRRSPTLNGGDLGACLGEFGMDDKVLSME
jgi:hypothetical protein